MSGSGVFESVAIVPHSEYRGLFPSIAEGLKRRHDSRITLVCATREEKSFYESSFPGLFNRSYCHRLYDTVLSDVEDKGLLLREARGLEAQYGFLFSHLFADDRHLGLGFSPGGINFPRSVFSRSGDYWRGLNAFVRLVRFLEEVISEQGITLVINPGKAFALVARGRGIPVRIFTATRHKNYYYWAVNDVLESNLIQQAFSRLQDVECDDALDEQPQYYIQSSREALRAFGIKRTAYMAGYEIARRAWHKYKGYEKAKGYLLRDNVKAHLRIYRQSRQVRRLFTAKLEGLKGRDFVYFPLGVEPERSLTRDSPEFSHQGFALQCIAQNLPAGVLLAVKEHITAIGPRPDQFYKSLSLLPNVVLLDIMEPGLEVIRHSGLVATVTGTAGLEAVFMGVPVLSFGKHNIYKIVPHAHTITSWLDVENRIRDVLENREEGAGKRCRDGSRFLRAMKEISVDCGETDFNQPIRPRLLASILDSLQETLQAG